MVMVDKDYKQMMMKETLMLTSVSLVKASVPVFWGKSEGETPDFSQNILNKESFTVYPQYILSNRSSKIVSLACGLNH